MKHLSEALMRKYVRGEASEGEALLVDCHLHYCEICSAEIRRLALEEGLAHEGGGALAKEDSSGKTLSPVMAPGFAIDAVNEEEALSSGKIGPPPILSAYIPLDFEGPDPFAVAPWKRAAPGLDRLGIWRGSDGAIAFLLRVEPSACVPDHLHHGAETSVIFEGGYIDHTGAFGVGDVQAFAKNTEHVSVADPKEGCICLVVQDRPSELIVAKDTVHSASG